MNNSSSNTPYVKQYSNDGILSNPIVTSYPQNGDNREARRSYKQKHRFRGNVGHISLTVDKQMKYVRRIQVVKSMFGRTTKRIEHYTLVK